MRVALAYAKGYALRARCRLTGQRLVGGRGLLVFGSLDVRGPGVVEIGDGVIVEMKVTAWTHSAQATLKIGPHCFLNGTRFGCATEITIGRDVIIGEAHIMDSDFHSTAANRWSPEAVVRVKPVRLADNVWVGAAAGLLPGTNVGENSVVGYGAVCSGTYPANSIIAGNPARVVKPIPGVDVV
jgi:acetyltransferase-like isoleucine patch superfamily enzyme